MKQRNTPPSAPPKDDALSEQAQHIADTLVGLQAECDMWKSTADRLGQLCEVYLQELRELRDIAGCQRTDSHSFLVEKIKGLTESAWRYQDLANS